MKTSRYQHIAFYRLNHGEEFFIGKVHYCKSGYFTALSTFKGTYLFVAPWRKVRSTRPFRKVPAVISLAENNRALGYLAKTHCPVEPYLAVVKATTVPVAGEETRE